MVIVAEVSNTFTQTAVVLCKERFQCDMLSALNLRDDQPSNLSVVIERNCQRRIGIYILIETAVVRFILVFLELLPRSGRIGMQFR